MSTISFLEKFAEQNEHAGCGLSLAEVREVVNEIKRLRAENERKSSEISYVQNVVFDYVNHGNR